MEDTLMMAARHFDVATHASAGPGRGPSGAPIWASWPRHPLDVAHDALAQVIRCNRDAGIMSTGRPNLWRAYSGGGWAYEGTFVDAVARLALHVAEGEHLRQSNVAG